MGRPYAVSGDSRAVGAVRSCVSLLLVSRNKSDQARIFSLMSRCNWRMRAAASIEEAMATLSDGAAPVVVSDLQFPDGDWRKLIEKCAELEYPPKVMVIAESPDTRIWDQVILGGVHHVLERPINPEEFFREVFQAWHAARRQWEKTAIAPISPRSEEEEWEAKSSMPAGAA
jgi:DNA-binding NtrC family response regulator